MECCGNPFLTLRAVHVRTSAKLRSMAASNPSPGATLPQLPAAHPAIRSQRGQLFLLLLPFRYAARVAFASRAAAVCPEHPKDAVNRVGVCRRAFLPFAFRICFARVRLNCRHPFPGNKQKSAKCALVGICLHTLHQYCLCPLFALDARILVG